MKQKILFVTNRNILTTCGELRLIKNRAETLFSEYEIPTDFIVLANSKRKNSEQKETINSGGNITIIRQDVNNLISIISAKIELRMELQKRMQSGDYSLIIFSGVGMPSYAKLVKRNSPTTKVFADVHGASEDIIELVKDCPMKRKVFNRIVYLLDKHGIKSSVLYLDGYFVVTEALKDYLRQNYKINSKAEFYIAPCATVKTDEGYFKKYEEYRRTYRAKYNIEDLTKVFIYSGGVSSWQCIEETISLYKKIKEKIIDSRLLLFSHNIDSVLKLVGDDKDIIVDMYRPEELTKALCAGDFAFMLRTDCITNNVAFPNKFLEYVQSKMKIITTPYVYEIAKQIKENELGFLYKTDNNLRELITFINTSKTNSDGIVKSVLSKNSFEVRLKLFNDYFKSI